MRRTQVAGIVTVLLALLSVPLPRSFAQSPQVPVQDTLAPADLEELLGPIALYPDTLLANVMAACCYPDELKKASAYVKQGGTPDKIAEQGWEPSVQAVAKVPDALKVLENSPDWAAAIGQAYIVQSKDVMAAIQSLRAKAKKSGALASNQQQTVVEDGTTIIIEPAQPQVVAVPQYQPQVVYAPPPPGPSPGAVAATNMISFGVGMMVGAAFSDNDCDWNGGSICHGGDVDIDIENNVNVNRNVNNSRTNVDASNRTRNTTRAGSQGTAWKPNQQKVAAQSTARTNELGKYKGAGSGANPTGSAIPGRGGGTASPSAAAGRVANPGAGQPRSTAAPQRQANAPQTSAPRPSPAAKSSPDRQPSAFSTDAGTNASRQRGAASRTSGGSRGAAGGGGRAGGGARGGGRGR
jgi:hypothetical protein